MGYSTVLNAMSPGARLNVVGDKARAQLNRLYPDRINNVVVDTTKQPLTFGTASAIADEIMEDNPAKTQLVYNRFASAISFKPTIATVLSSEELEKAAEEGVNQFDSYEIEGPDRSEFLLDLSEFKMGALLYNAMLRTTRLSWARACNRWRTRVRMRVTCFKSSLCFTPVRVKPRLRPS